jgi:sugar lactone lactonase YvrE
MTGSVMKQNSEMPQVEIVENTPLSQLGEGIIWHPVRQVWYWVDITGQQLHRYDPVTRQTVSIMLESMIGTVVPATGQFQVLVAMETGIYGMDEKAMFRKVSDYPLGEHQDNRFNDGKCDPAGRFWMGTMNKQVQKAAGNLYVFDGRSLMRKEHGVTISNGLAWSNDRSTMYYTDTYEYAIYAYDFDLESGEIGNRRVAIQVPEKEGAPDGMTIDEEGMLWVAHWGGGAVIRWNPLTGEVVQKIELPAPHITSCAFGGVDHQTLFITSAREGLSTAELENYPLSGSLFRVHTDCKGAAVNLFNNTQR